MKKIILRDIIRSLREDLAEHSAAIGRLSQEKRRLVAELNTMRETWRPIPIQHQWEPRDGRCALCNEDRSAARHDKGVDR